MDKSLSFQEQFGKDCLDALDAVGIAGCRRVGLVSRVDMNFDHIRNGGGILLLVLEAANFAFMHCPGIMVNTKMVFFSIYLFLCN